MSTLPAIGRCVDAYIDGKGVAGGYAFDGGMAGDVLAVSRARTRHGHNHGILVMDGKRDLFIGLCFNNEGHHRSSNGAIWPIMDNHTITTTSTNLNRIISHLSYPSYTKSNTFTIINTNTNSPSSHPKPSHNKLKKRFVCILYITFNIIIIYILCLLCCCFLSRIYFST